MRDFSVNGRPVVIATPRLYLCEFHSHDAQVFFDMNADNQVLRYTGDEPFDSIEETAAFIKGYDHYRLSGFGRWSVLLRSNGKTIGWCGLKDHGDYIDLGFRFLRSEWNKGYASEAAAACIEYAFRSLGLDELVGRVARENKASIRVLEKIGMSYWRSGDCEGIEDAMYFRIKNDA